MPDEDAVRGTAIARLPLLALTSLVLKPAAPEELTQGEPKSLVHCSPAVQSVGHHRGADISRPCERRDGIGPGTHITIVRAPEGRQLLARQQETGSHIVTEHLNGIHWITPADSRLAEPQMCEFVEQREASRARRILRIDDDERSDLIRQRKASKDLHVQLGVVAPQGCPAPA